MDSQVFHLINNLALKNPILDQVGIFFSEIAIFLLAATAVIVMAKKGRQALISASLAFVLVVLIDRILNLVVSVPRPFVENKVNLLIPELANPSFPSTHAAAAATAALLIAYFSKKSVGLAVITIAIFVGISRIFVGVHYPSDVLAGWVLGVAAFITSVKLMVRLRSPSNPERSRMG